MLEQTERESLLAEVLGYARDTGKSPGEIQALIVGGAILLGFEQVSQNINDQNEAIESLIESVDTLVVAVRDTLDDTIRETSEDLKDALVGIEEALEGERKQEK